jgi:hypothetical protein
MNSFLKSFGISFVISFIVGYIFAIGNVQSLHKKGELMDLL